MHHTQPEELVGKQIWIPDLPINDRDKIGRLAVVVGVDAEGKLDVEIGVQKAKLSVRQLLGTPESSKN